MTDFEKKHNIVNQHYPPNSLLKGKYKKTFAHCTLRERIPIIYTNLIDELLKVEADILTTLPNSQSREELYQALENIKKLVHELKNNKTLTKLSGSETDKDLWNNFLSELPLEERTYFSTCWLWAECYLYRRLKSIFESSKTLMEFDYFQSYKKKALSCSTDALIMLSVKTREILNADHNIEDQCKKMLHLQLWGNRCDLSISDGQEVKQTGDQLQMIDNLKPYILTDHTDEIWNLLSKPYTGERIIDIICDNAGYELFTDLLLAEYLIETGLATKIRFHTKAIPWFISDTTPSDFHWTLKFLMEHESPDMSIIGKKWTQLLQQDKFSLLKPDRFWVSPYEFYRMKEVSPKLYERLGESHLVIIKGDLNYRKLIGDYSWSSTENFEVCLRGFNPTNICSLRTIKADLICGLKPGVAELLFKTDPNWMLTGEYATIKLSKKK